MLAPSRRRGGLGSTESNVILFSHGSRKQNCAHDCKRHEQHQRTGTSPTFTAVAVGTMFSTSGISGGGGKAGGGVILVALAR